MIHKKRPAHTHDVQTEHARTMHLGLGGCCLSLDRVDALPLQDDRSFGVRRPLSHPPTFLEKQKKKNEETTGLRKLSAVSAALATTLPPKHGRRASPYHIS